MKILFYLRKHLEKWKLVVVQSSYESFQSLLLDLSLWRPFASLSCTELWASMKPKCLWKPPNYENDELERAQNFWAQALRTSTRSGLGFEKLGFQAKNSLAYHMKIQLRVTFKFWAWLKIYHGLFGAFGLGTAGPAFTTGLRARA